MAIQFTCGYCKEKIEECKCGGAVPEIDDDCEECEKKDEKIEELMDVVRTLMQQPDDECTVILRVDPMFMDKVKGLHDGKMPN